jgi:hypothetical protein
MENKINDEHIVDANKMKDDTPTLASSFTNLDESGKMMFLALFAGMFGGELFKDNDKKGDE